jgi:hypothetical protein
MMRRGALLGCLVVALLLWVPAARADCSGNWCTGVTITEVLSQANNLEVTFVGTSGTETGLTCTPASNERLRINNTDPNAPYVHSLILTALATNAVVDIFATDDAGGRCHIDLMKVFPN